MNTVSSMLDSGESTVVLVDDVLEKSGISRGSLYHHFGDFENLVHTTLIARFSANVEADARGIWKAVESAKSKEDFWRQIRKLSALTQVPERAAVRAERARLISMATARDDFAASLAKEQDRLTGMMADAIAVAQDKGWVKSTFSSRAITLFLQAYSLGRAVDDIAETHISNHEWVDLIDTVLATFEA